MSAIREDIKKLTLMLFNQATLREKFISLI